MMTLQSKAVLPNITLAAYVLCLTIGSLVGGLWAGIAIALGLIVYLIVAIEKRSLPVPSTTLFIGTTAFLATLAAHNLISTYPEKSWSLWVNLATGYLPLCLLFTPALRENMTSSRLMPVLACCATLGAIALGIELSLRGTMLATLHGADASLAKYNRGMSYLVLMAMPILAYLWQSKHRWLIIPFLLILVFPTGLTESRAAKLALILACGTIIAGYILPRILPYILGAMLCLCSLWPFVSQWIFAHYQDRLSKIPDSWHHRIEIWDYMSFRIMEKPLLGWGLGASGEVDYSQPHGTLYNFAHERAGHSHNFITQLWVELGLPGLLIALAFGLFTLWQCRRLSPAHQPYALGAWVAALTLSLVAYNFWTDSLMAAFALTALAFSLIQQESKNRLLRAA